jgi:tetratricopeptide (TPR) repeat protein
VSSRYLQKTTLFVTAALIALGSGCSPRGKGANHAALEKAIASYIAGDYERAAHDLDALSRSLESDEDVLTAYLYLGRSYEALGDYVSAADAYSSGRILGGGVVFEEHLASVQGHLRSTPRSVRTQPAVTRAQVAALTVRLAGITDDAVVEREVASDLRGHWAESYATTVVDLGIMDSLPDGHFHPEDAVTLASFYVIVLKASRALGASTAPLGDSFPGGFETVLHDGTTLVTGEQAAEVLQAVLARTEH